MTDEDCPPVAVSRRICAPAHDIFQVLASPARHHEFDGSESLRDAPSPAIVSGVGDVFVMKMYFPRLGDYEMNNHVVEFEPDRRIGWEPAAGRGHPSAAPDGASSDRASSDRASSDRASSDRASSDRADPARWGQRWSYQLTPDGPGATIVTEIYDCSRAPAEERAGMDNGRVWIGSMTETLERLNALCTRSGPYDAEAPRS